MTALLADAVWRASLQGAIFVAVVAVLCRLFARMPPWLRAALYWLASLKLLVGLVMAPVRLALLPAPPAATANATSPAPVEPLAAPAAGPEAAPGSPAAAAAGLDFRLIVTLLWLGGAAVSLATVGRRAARARRLRRESTPLPAAEGPALASLARRLGIARLPPIHVSAAAGSPQLLGLWRPLIVVPPGLRPDELAMAVAHELAHLRRRDLWLGWVPALVERLFFFHPLARLAAREYALCREAACDETVLALAGVAPAEYGRLLVRFGVSRPAQGVATLAMGSSVQDLKRRLQMMSHASPRPRRWWRTFLCIGALGLIPVTVVAKEKGGKKSSCKVVIVTEAGATERPCRPADVEEVRRLQDQGAPQAAEPAPDDEAAPGDTAREAERESRREALREAEREALRERREALREAERARREALRDAERARRDAQRAARDAERARREAHPDDDGDGGDNDAADTDRDADGKGGGRRWWRETSPREGARDLSLQEMQSCVAELERVATCLDHLPYAAGAGQGLRQGMRQLRDQMEKLHAIPMARRALSQACSDVRRSLGATLADLGCQP
jgi:beta-lactamase regulating signal transducer with metallopeptidase domain